LGGVLELEGLRDQVVHSPGFEMSFLRPRTKRKNNNKPKTQPKELGFNVHLTLINSESPGQQNLELKSKICCIPSGSHQEL